jgi:uncharacterized membrane protein
MGLTGGVVMDTLVTIILVDALSAPRLAGGPTGLWREANESVIGIA